MNADNGGIKADQEKPRMDLLPPDAMLAVGRVLASGAQRYGDRNWERGMDWGRVIAAAHRHLFAIQMGEDYDWETGEPHAAHLACCALFLTAFLQRGIGNDDRNKLVTTTAITPSTPASTMPTPPVPTTVNVEEGIARLFNRPAPMPAPSEPEHE